LFDCVVVCRAFIPESLASGHGSEIPSVMMLVVKNQDSVVQVPALILPAGTILMGNRSIAHGMVPLLMLIDALIMEIFLKISDRQRMKHAVHVAEGKRGDQTLHVAQ
jgi:hypothetical protein